MGKRQSRFGVLYKSRSVLKKLPFPDHDMTKEEAGELKDLESKFTRLAHRLGVHVSIELKFPATSEGGEE